MKRYILLGTFFLLFFNSCEDFLSITPEGALTLDNYYTNEEQCAQALYPMYGFAWFNFNDKASYAIGDLYAGNMYTTSDEFFHFQNFTVQNNNIRAFEAWSTCYGVIAHANGVIQNLPRPAKENGVSESAINGFIAEAKFMRAMAYFYLVRIFGPVPIIEDGAKTVLDAIIPKINEDDIYKFILKDLEFAYENTPIQRTGTASGRVAKGAVLATMAKVYLTMKDYTTAKTKLEEVIGLGVYQLLPDYKDLFLRSTSDNNVESIYAWQWVANLGWATQNTHQAFFAVTGDITKVGDGWATVLPSVDLINAFEAGDARKHEILMQDGDTYPELLEAEGGFTYVKAEYGNDINAGIKKYVVGSPDDDKVGFMSTGINTDVIRYADVLLMYVEAVMGKNTITNDAKALGYFNEIRKRAKLSTKTSVTRDELLKERRIEFAMEAQFFYDVVRILGEEQAITYFSNTERGRFADDGSVISKKSTCKSVKFGIPTSEADQNPLLRKDPQPYDWSQSEYSGK